MTNHQSKKQVYKMRDLANLRRIHISKVVVLMIFSILMINGLRMFCLKRQIGVIKRQFNPSLYRTKFGQKFDSNGTKYSRTRVKKQICRKYGLDKKNKLKSLRDSRLLKTIIVDEKHKALFCYVPKVASGNWKRIFLVLKGDYNDMSDIETTVAHKESLLKTLENYTNKEIRRKIQEYESYVVVREPMERLLSAYLNKIHHDYTGKYYRLFGKKIMKYSRTIPQGEVKQNISFAEFVEFITRAPEKEAFELHWERIHRFCHPCLIDYGYIGRYENLSKDAQRIIGSIAPASDIVFPTYGKQSDRNNTKSFMLSYFSQITEKQLSKLLSLYELDYLLFDYPKPQYLFKVVKQDKGNEESNRKNTETNRT